jgi:predicted phage terminase large subunit-like protein
MMNAAPSALRASPPNAATRTFRGGNKSKPTPDQALQVRVERELARRSFLNFCQYVDEKFEINPHIKLLGDYLQQVARYVEMNGAEGISRLMIMMPPRHGKSELASRKFPAYLLGRRPDSRIILTSYGADLASKNSRDVREIVTSKAFQALFGAKSSKDEPVLLSSDSRSVTAWDLANPYSGGVVAAGVGGGITGLGADLLVLDDPFKNREEAESDTRRDLVEDWWKSSARTRLSPWGAVVLFHTRWHPDDLAGRMIGMMASDPQADQWTVVNLPALALDGYAASVEDQKSKMLDGIYLPLEDQLGREPGEALWPSHFSKEWLASARVNVGAYDFEALYQQQPYPKSGQKYKRDWFKMIAKMPDEVKIVYAVRLWDKANSTKGDYTAGALMAYGSDGYFYILDVVRGQWSSYDRDQKMLKTTVSDKELFGKVYTWHQQDPGSAGKDSAEATNRLLMGFPVKFETVTGDKATRSEPLESAFQGGLVFLLKGAWNDAFVDECVAFDRGKNDDQVDAASGAYNKLLEMIGTHRKSRIG